MKKIAQILNSIVAVALVAAICNIYITEYLCNLRHEMADASEQHSHSQSHKHQDSETIAEEDHDADHDHEAVEHQHDKKDAEHHSHSGKSEEGGCCKTFTSSFYSALNKPGTVQFSFSKTLLIVFAPLQAVSFKSWMEPRPSELFCYKSPPPKIPDIRIFIQSFLI